MKIYRIPQLTSLEKINFNALTATGDFNFIVNISQGQCCEDQNVNNCDFPTGVPIPGTIDVSDGQITLLFGVSQAQGCQTVGPIDFNGHFSIDISSCFNNSFCDNSGQEPNGCCPRSSVVSTIQGTFDGSHMDAQINHHEDVPEGDMDCGDSNNSDCTDLGTIMADPA